MGRSAAVACVVIVLFALAPSVAAAATASFVATPSTARVGQEVVFDASLSTGIPPLHYTWDFGDDEYVDTTQPGVSHVYTERGSYTVELEVEDDEFEFATAQRTVTVADEFGATAGPTPSEIARAGHVTAGAFYSEGSRNVRLKIARDGVTALNVVFRKICRFCSVEPAGFGRRASVRVRDLDADTEPEVVVDLYTGGAHCCFYSRIFAWDSAAGAYLGVTKQWSDVGYHLSDDGDGAAEFSTADTRFAYVFASFAESFFPVRVLHFVGGRMRDVTRAFEARVRRDAGRLWRYYLRRRGTKHWNVRGVLAAYMADKYVLRESRDGWRQLEAALRRGDLDAQPLFGSQDVYPHGEDYLEVLRRRLSRWGYRP